jgi:hypothetical protein
MRCLGRDCCLILDHFEKNYCEPPHMRCYLFSRQDTKKSLVKIRNAKLEIRNKP